MWRGEKSTIKSKTVTTKRSSNGEKMPTKDELKIKRTNGTYDSLKDVSDKLSCPSDHSAVSP